MLPVPVEDWIVAAESFTRSSRWPSQLSGAARRARSNRQSDPSRLIAQGPSVQLPPRDADRCGGMPPEIRGLPYTVPSRYAEGGISCRIETQLESFP